MKTNEWLTAESFEYSYRLLSAINTLSIHAKLLLDGVDDSDRSEQVQNARRLLKTFLDRVTALIRDSEERRNDTVLGADPQLRELATKFIPSKTRATQAPPACSISLPGLSNLLTSESPQDLKTLVDTLRELRVLIEQQAHADVGRILAGNMKKGSSPVV